MSSGTKLVLTIICTWSIVINTAQIQLYDKFCVTGSALSAVIDGTYEYSHFDSNTNLSVWYNKEKNQYLFPWIVSQFDRQYLIGPDPTSFTAHSHCQVNSANDCDKGWRYGNYINDTHSTFQDDTNMRLVHCNDMCITFNNSNKKQSLFGTYIWQQYDYRKNCSVFYSSSNDKYLYNDVDNGWTVYNQSYTNTNSNNDINIQKCSKSCDDGITTHYYGVSNTNPQLNATNQGQINDTLLWAVYNDSSSTIYKAIGNLEFISTQQSITTSNDSLFISCNPFKLERNDYINGYRVIYKEHVYGLFFYTINNNEYNCIANDLNYDNYYDTGIISDNNYYLSAFNIRYTTVIHSISFQFTSIDNCTLNPTLSPTMNPTKLPTLYPTLYPSMQPTVTPTLYPTLHPTLYPTKNPTLSPTENPSLQPTISPTSYPTLYPTMQPTVTPTLYPTLYPTLSPMENPSLQPTISPTLNPTNAPTINPATAVTDLSSETTNSPSTKPTIEPTFNPTFGIRIIDENVTVSISTTKVLPIAYGVESGILHKSTILLISAATVITLLTIVLILKKLMCANNKNDETPKVTLPPKQTYSTSTKQSYSASTKQTMSTTTNTNTEMTTQIDTKARQKKSADMLNQIWNSYSPSGERPNYLDKGRKDESSDSDLYEPPDDPNTPVTATGGEILEV